jgi:predicted O-methyltransferase YrrM
MIKKFFKKKLIDLIDFLYLGSYKFYSFGKKFDVNSQYYKNLFLEIKNNNYNEVDKIEDKFGYKLEKNWLDNLAFVTQIVKKSSKINYSHGRLIYSVLRNYFKKNINLNYTILETGTARGFSSICMSKALIDHNVKGKIITVDVIGHDQKIYWNCFKDELGKFTRSELIKEWQDELDNIIFLKGRTSIILQNLGLKRVNFAFLDGQHDRFSVEKEFSYVSIRQKRGDIIFFDDVTSAKYHEIYKFVSEIKNSNKYSIELISISEERGYAVATKN